MLEMQWESYGKISGSRQMAILPTSRVATTEYYVLAGKKSKCRCRDHYWAGKQNIVPGTRVRGYVLRSDNACPDNVAQLGYAYRKISATQRMN